MSLPRIRTKGIREMTLGIPEMARIGVQNDVTEVATSVDSMELKIIHSFPHNSAGAASETYQ